MVTDEFDALVHAFMANHDTIERIGTPEMKAASKLLLFEMGREVARKLNDNRAQSTEENGDG